jgi:hypothetical protein
MGGDHMLAYTAHFELKNDGKAETEAGDAHACCS